MKRGKELTLALGLFWTSACTTNLEKGKELATAGRVAAESLHAAANQTAEDFRSNARRSALLQQLGKAASPAAPISSPRADVEGFMKNAALLQTRAQMIEGLVALYANLEEGMKFNAREETRVEFTELVNSVDAYRAAVKAAGGTLADRPATDGVGQLAGLFAQAVQQKNMVAASRLVREELQRVKEALEQEQQLLLSARTTSALLKRNLAEAMRQQGLADPTPHLEEMVGLADAKVAPDASKAYQSNRRLRDFLGEYETWDNETFQPELIKASYVKSLEVLDELAKQHRKFEDGEPLSPDFLISKAEELRSIYKLLQGDI